MQESLLVEELFLIYSGYINLGVFFPEGYGLKG